MVGSRRCVSGVGAPQTGDAVISWITSSFDGQTWIRAIAKLYRFIHMLRAAALADDDLSFDLLARPVDLRRRVEINAAFSRGIHQFAGHAVRAIG